VRGQVDNKATTNKETRIVAYRKRQGEREIKPKELGLLEKEFPVKYKLFITKSRGGKSVTSTMRILSDFFY
jgi:hypothetical protein